MIINDMGTSIVIYVIAAISLLFALMQYIIIRQTKIFAGEEKEVTPLMSGSGRYMTRDARSEKLREIHFAISTGAEAFLSAEYRICIVFLIVFALIIFFLISWGQNSLIDGCLTAIAFILGACTSILAGYIGMKVAVFANVRTTINAQKAGYVHCFNSAFRAGTVMGFALCGLGILVLITALLLFRLYFDEVRHWGLMMDCIAGYGLGGSSIALFGRVGGGIFTKAADVGADLVGKVVHGIPEDDARNPATIADNVGDNVGDVAGMGADLFGSFAESTCAALVIAAHCDDLLLAGWGAMCYPILISAAGIIICLLTSFLATNIFPVNLEKNIETALRLQLVVSTTFMVPASLLVAYLFLPTQFQIIGVSRTHTSSYIEAWLCGVVGSVGGLIIGLFTEYFTSQSYNPVMELVEACTTGAATNIIYGLALGYKSVVVAVITLAVVVFVAFHLCDLYGLALAAVGMLSTLSICLSIDAYGPVCDNAGGIAEMAFLPEEIRHKTDALDAAGNTTAAIGKGFAIGSAALVSLALYGAFVTRIRAAMARSGISSEMYRHVDILEPLTFAFLLIGAMMPYWFSSMTTLCLPYYYQLVKSVGKAAMMMIKEVERQFAEKPELLDEMTTQRPDYARCVKISTEASLREMMAPAALVILAPLVIGTFFGVFAVYGLLTGALLSGVQMAIAMANTGGAWDNAKKFIAVQGSGSRFGGKGSECHKASVIGDTVGDPLKDTAGPSLNILMKLMAIISLVFADFFFAINHGRGLFGIPVA